MARVAVDFWFEQGAREEAGSTAILPERGDTAQAKKRRNPAGERGWGRLLVLLVGHGVNGTRSLLAPPPSSPIDARAGYASISTGSLPPLPLFSLSNWGKVGVPFGLSLPFHGQLAHQENPRVEEPA